MENKLNKEQVAYVSKWIKARGVTYYDVNMEMTDHMSSEIEELMNADIQLSFTDSEKQVSTKYSCISFKEIEKEKEKKVQKQAVALWRKTLVQFVTFPKAILTMLIFLLALQSLSYVEYKYILFVIWGTSTIITLAIFLKKKKVLGVRKFIQLKFVMTRYFFLFFLPLNFVSLEPLLINSVNNPDYILAGVITLVTIMLTVLFQLHNKHINTLKLQYA